MGLLVVHKEIPGEVDGFGTDQVSDTDISVVQPVPFTTWAMDLILYIDASQVTSSHFTVSYSYVEKRVPGQQFKATRLESGIVVPDDLVFAGGDKYRQLVMVAKSEEYVQFDINVPTGDIEIWIVSNRRLV